jgi:hypothetical protein
MRSGLVAGLVALAIGALLTGGCGGGDTEGSASSDATETVASLEADPSVPPPPQPPAASAPTASATVAAKTLPILTSVTTPEGRRAD